MPDRNLLSVVVLAAVTLLTACISVKYFTTFAKPESAIVEIPTQTTQAEETTTAADGQVQAWKLADAAAMERASAAAAQQEGSAKLSDNIASLLMQGADVNDEDAYNEYLEKIKKALDGGSLSYDRLFRNTVFVGDSVVATLGLYGYIDTDRCFALANAGLSWLEQNIPTLITMNPSYIVIHIGMGMLQADTEYMNTNFIGVYKTLLTNLHTSLPEAELIVSGIFPITAAAEVINPQYAMRTQYNEALRKMCDENGFIYLDNDAILTAHMDCIGADGVYPTGLFYEQYWLQYLFETAKMVA